MTTKTSIMGLGITIMVLAALLLAGSMVQQCASGETSVKDSPNYGYPKQGGGWEKPEGSGR